ncbi:hypothetical protein FHL15_003968 [Xylaria flabelliformis]|uniref:SET domain-containing protein n=1 Tax=Xylaria flabelliformis TaxID=2512241 RepID=A0A553I4Z0_9PEZI|nr:hypothetical protein FHL15_003968 [Xylaria flabelliformis]
MRRGHFPLSSLPAWCVFNSITFAGVDVADVDGRGLGLVAEKDLNNESNNLPALLTIPKELILSATGIEAYAKENKDFRQLLDVAGHQVAHSKPLLVDSWVNRGQHSLDSILQAPPFAGPSPDFVPAVSAKLRALEREFNHIRDTTRELPRWNALLEIDEAVTLSDWILLDALYRSRSLALPKSGESMVPCLDLCNHSTPATAFFEENAEDEVVLFLHKGANVLKQDEVTIDYGHDKSAAEMLFSYGFIDSTSTAKSIVLPVESMDDDPLAKAKLYIFGPAPTLKIIDNDNEAPYWDAPFVHLMCLNDEDGLHFKVLRETDGSQHLRMFWQDIDITGEAGNIESVIKGHDLYHVFRLRAVAVVLGVVQQQLEALAASDEENGSNESLSPHIGRAISQFRAAEKNLLERAFQILEREKNQLLETDSVTAYLATMNAPQQNDIDNEDFA